MKTKTFDCVEMKRQGAERVQETLKRMTPKERLDYWDKKYEQLAQRQKELQKQAQVL